VGGVRRRGRPQVSISTHTNPSEKLKRFEKKLVDWAGSKDEANALLKAYLASPRWVESKKENTNDDVLKRIGEAMCTFVEQLPYRSPFRKPILQAMSQKVKAHELQEVLPFSRTTIHKSLKMDPNDNPLLTTKNKAIPLSPGTSKPDQVLIPPDFVTNVQ
jgi:hypothetical protein